VSDSIGKSEYAEVSVRDMASFGSLSSRLAWSWSFLQTVPRRSAAS